MSLTLKLSPVESPKCHTWHCKKDFNDYEKGVTTIKKNRKNLVKMVDKTIFRKKLVCEPRSTREHIWFLEKVLSTLENSS